MTTIYQAVFPISSRSSLEDLAKCTKQWITQSPHNKITLEQLQGIDVNGFAYINNDSSKEYTIISHRYDFGLKHILGIEYTVRDRNVIFKTSLVGSKKETRFDLAIILDFYTSDLGQKIPYIKSPLITSKIIYEMEGGLDGDLLMVRSKPYYLKDIDLELVADIVDAKSNNSLPIVYMSYSNEHQLINPNHIAKELSGLAHVLVEPSKSFSSQLGRTAKNNAYNGVIGLHWPDGRIYRVYVKNKITNIFYPKELILDEIINTIKSSSLLRLLPDDLTVQGIKSLRTTREMEILKETKQQLNEDNEAEKLRITEQALELYSDELEVKDRKIAEMHNNIIQLQGIISSKSRQTQGVIITPDYPLLYQDEIADLILEVCKEFLDGKNKDSRSYQIIQKTLENNENSGRKNEIMEEIKNIFSGNPNINATMKQKLNRLGFEVEPTNGGHQSIYVKGDPTHSVTVGSSSSDHRAGKNTISTIKKVLL